MSTGMSVFLYDNFFQGAPVHSWCNVNGANSALESRFLLPHFWAKVNVNTEELCLLVSWCVWHSKTEKKTTVWYSA